MADVASHEIERLLTEYLELPTEKRPSFLSLRCSNPEIRQKLVELARDSNQIL